MLCGGPGHEPPQGHRSMLRCHHDGTCLYYRSRLWAPVLLGLYRQARIGSVDLADRPGHLCGCYGLASTEMRDAFISAYWDMRCSGLMFGDLFPRASAFGSHLFMK